MAEQITAAGNTLVPMVLALRAAGFHVARAARSGSLEWTAESQDLRLSADDLPGLVALAFMRQVRGPHWKASDSQIDAVFSEFGDL